MVSLKLVLTTNKYSQLTLFIMIFDLTTKLFTITILSGMNPLLKSQLTMRDIQEYCISYSEKYL